MRTPSGASQNSLLRMALVAGLCSFLAAPLRADQVIADDLIIQGAASFGLDSVNGQSFGFNTIVLRENNLRIFFDDTSSGSHPANKWTLIANDTTDGGANYFGIEDTTSGRLSFRVDAGAPTNTLRVSSSGNVGIGKDLPELDLHINTGDTPGVRLEQNNGGGFSAQTWDVAGNEANFFIRDLTGGSKLSFRIRPGAPTSSLDIAANGFLGAGTGSPAAKLHVMLQNSDVASNDGVLIARNDYAHPGTKFTLHVGGTAFVSQTLEIGSSRERKENIKDLDLRDAEEALAKLEPVHFNYKSTTQHQLGFISEDVPDLVATESRKSLVPMSFIAVLTKVAQKHESRARELEKTVAAQQELLKAMSARLDALEQRSSSARTASLSSAPAPSAAARAAERQKFQDHLETSAKPAASAQSTPPPPAPVVDNGR